MSLPIGTPRRRPSFRVAGVGWRQGAVSLSLAAMAVAASAQGSSAPAQHTSLDDPFFQNAQAGYNLRTFSMDRENDNGSLNQAWAGGGWLYARSGFWRDALQLGATYYFSLPLHAPDDTDGTQLLAPGQDSIGVLGELYARLRYEKQTLTLHRQEIDMGYARMAGVRANRSDLGYVGKLDNRMVPVTYQAALLGGPLAEQSPAVGSISYWAGYVWDAKPRDSSQFIPMGQAIGAKGSDAGMSMAGLQWSPMKDLWAQAWYHQVNDVLAIGFADLDYVGRLSGQSYWRLATQYTRQTSAGGTALAGKSFSTWNWEAYGEFGWQRLTAYGAYSKIGQAQQIRTPFSSGPIYTQMLTRNFTQAGEETFVLGGAVKLDSLASGLSLTLDAANGRRAVNPASGAAVPDEREVDFGILWTYREKGSMFDGVRARLRKGWVYDQAPTGTQRGTDLRLDLNWPIRFL
jgi:hypothetical protein